MKNLCKRAAVVATVVLSVMGVGAAHVDAAPPIGGGTAYVVANELSASQVLTAYNDRVWTRYYGGSDLQEWWLRASRHDTILLVNKGTGRCASQDPFGDPAVILLPCAESPYSEWIIERNPDGTATLVAGGRPDSYCLDMAAPVEPAIVVACDGTPSQRWSLYTP